MFSCKFCNRVPKIILSSLSLKILSSLSPVKGFEKYFCSINIKKYRCMCGIVFEVFVFEVLVFVIFVLEKLSFRSHCFCFCCPFTLLRFSWLKLHQRVFQNENMHILEGILGNVRFYTCWYKKLVMRWQKF